METRSKKIMSMLNIPRYETTKGLNQDERNLVLASVSPQRTPPSTSSTLSEVTSSAGPSGVSLSKPIIIHEIKVFHEDFMNEQNKITSPSIPFQSTITFNSSLKINNIDDCSSSKGPQELNYDSDWSEPKTSGSEYIVDSDSILSETSSENSISNKTTKNVYPKFIKKRQGKSEEKTKPKRTLKNQHLKLDLVKEKSVLPDSTTQDDNVLSDVVDSDGEKNVKIKGAMKTDGKRIRNKMNSCYFCQRMMTNAARHFEKIHGKEMEVAKITSLPKGSQKRRDGFAQLIRVGNFYHNCDVIAMKKGELILARRPTQAELNFVTYNDYGPCPQCLGFMLKKHLWLHLKNNCTAIKTEETGHDHSRHIIAESNAILNDAFGSKFTNDFTKNIISKLRNDEIGSYCSEDNLILKYGAMQFEKYGTTQCELIRQQMRQLARLTMQLRKTERSNKHLSDFLIPQKFDIIVQCTKMLCVCSQNAEKRPEFGVPSLALKLGFSLKKCASILRGSALRAGNLMSNERLQSFLSLMEMEWSIRISSNALATLYNRKVNATQLLPLTSDLVKLSEYLDKEITRAKEVLAKSCTIQNFGVLASITLAKIILFNKRRSGEASRMTLQNYLSRPVWSEQCTQELKESLTPFEQQLAHKLCIVEIIGKRGKKVPVLLTEQMKLAVDDLVTAREQAGIAKENYHVFARPGNALSYIRGNECLRKACTDAALDNPDNITSTKLRKYVATVCQVFNLSENEYDWLARHLGHDVRVHREFYRLHESAVELTKISRLLIAVDKGEVNKFAGKSLQDINLQDLPPVEEESEGEEEKEEMGEDTDYRNKDNCTEQDSGKICDSSDENSGEGEESRKVEDSNDHRNIYDCTNTETSRKQKNGTKSSKRKLPKGTSGKTNGVKKTCVSRDYSSRRPWTTEEKAIILEEFKLNIKKNLLPGKKQCEDLMNKYPLLKERKWSDLKYFVKNHLTKIHKKTINFNN